MKVYWGATPGTVDSVIDVTHNVEVNFSQQNRATYGFVRDWVGQSVSPIDLNPDGIVTYFDYVQGPCFNGMPSWSVTGCGDRFYEPSATLTAVDTDGDGVSDGNGFAMMLAGEPYFFQTDALPAAPAVWTLRTYSGLVYRENDGTGNYAFVPMPTNPAVPGLRLKVAGGAPRAAREITEDDLSNVHTLPDPYYVTSGLEITPQQKVIKFVNLPTQAIIRIYSVSGVLVDVVEHEDVALGGEATWDVRNRNNQFVASGVYFYHVETPTGAEKVGRFTVINSGNLAIGQQN
jgi:predicted secreted protein